LDRSYLLLVELVDVDYYRDLEMWVRSHSRSLKMVPFESVGTGFLFIFYSNYGAMLYSLRDILIDLLVENRKLWNAVIG